MEALLERGGTNEFGALSVVADWGIRTGDARKDYSGYSFWLATYGDDLTPRPVLDGSCDVDVAVLGAGFSGLWAAYYLLDKQPSLRIAIVEREIAGFGASGRIRTAWLRSA